MEGENDGAAVQAQGAGQQAAKSDHAAKQQQAPQQQASVTAGSEGARDGQRRQGRTRPGPQRLQVRAQRARHRDRGARGRDRRGGQDRRRRREAARRDGRAALPGNKQRVSFELTMAGAKNVKAARALLPDHDNDIEKLKAAEPWLFGEGAPAPAQTSAGGGEEAELKRWREIAGLDEK